MPFTTVTTNGNVDTRKPKAVVADGFGNVLGEQFDQDQAFRDASDRADRQADRAAIKSERDPREEAHKVDDGGDDEPTAFEKVKEEVRNDSVAPLSDETVIRRATPIHMENVVGAGPSTAAAQTHTTGGAVVVTPDGV